MRSSSTLSFAYKRWVHHTGSEICAPAIFRLQLQQIDIAYNFFGRVLQAWRIALRLCDTDLSVYSSLKKWHNMPAYKNIHVPSRIAFPTILAVLIRS